jgi:adenylate cyclase
LLVEFASVVDALRCAAEVQGAVAESNAPLPTDHRIEFRIGIHQGDIVVEDVAYMSYVIVFPLIL